MHRKASGAGARVQAHYPSSISTAPNADFTVADLFAAVKKLEPNVLSSAHERPVARLIREAIAQYNTGEPSIFYAKKEATTLIGAGVRFPKQLQAEIASNSIICRIPEKVNIQSPNIMQRQ